VRIYGTKKHGLWVVSIVDGPRSRLGWGTRIKRALLAGARLSIARAWPEKGDR